MILKVEEKKLIIFVKLNLVKSLTIDLLNFVDCSKLTLEFLPIKKRSQ